MGFARALDWVFVCFLASHVPITLFVDAQAVLPKEWFPELARYVHTWYLFTYRDPLMLSTPVWFWALCVSELTVQLPFFVAGAYGIAARRNWVRIPAIVYGSFVVATMVPILAELAVYEGEGYHMPTMMAFYLPYLLLPGLIAARFALAGERPYPALRAGAGGKKKAKKA